MAKKPQMIGVIGDSDAVMAFRTLGMRVISAGTPQQAAQAVHKMVKDKVPVVFISEDIARQIPDIMDHYSADPLVSLIPIPGTGGADGLGMQRLHANVEKAGGVDILLNNVEE